MSYFVGYGYESDQCSDDSLTGQCDGYVPDDDSDAPGAECQCACHGDEHFDTVEECARWHADKHMSMQDGAYHNIGYAN